MRLRTLILLLVLPIPALPTQAEDANRDMVTWANFNYIRSIASSIDHVYFGTSQGITRYDKVEHRWELPLTGTENIDDRDIQRVWIDGFDQKLYASTSTGLYEYNLLFSRWYSAGELPDLNNLSRHVAAPEVMFPPPAFNYNSSGILIDPTGRLFDFTDVLDDNSGMLWIGTWGYGALTAPTASNLLDLLPFGLIQNPVHTLFYDGERLWISGHTQGNVRTGISVMDVDSYEFSYLESGLTPDFPTLDINCLTGDEYAVFIGTEMGLYEFDRERETYDRIFGNSIEIEEDNVLSLLVTGDSVFAGTEEGLRMYDITKDSTYLVYPGELGASVIYDLAWVDSDIWIASSGGAFRLDMASEKLQVFQDPDLVLLGRVYDIEQNGDDLWFSSDDGLLRLNMATGDTQPIRSAVQRTDSRALAVNDDVVAIASDRGVTLIDYHQDPVRRRDFTTDDGLPSNVVNTLIMDGEYIWIGTDYGLTRFWWANPSRVD